jgi:hypothetical protein
MRKEAVAPIGLFFLSPLIAEFLLGNAAIDAINVVPFIAPLYGGGALLVREVARRTGRGWPTMILLAFAYAVIEEGLVTQSLFNPSYFGYDLLAAAHIAVMGGDLAASTAIQIEQGKKREGMDPGRERAPLTRIREDHEATTTPYFAAAHLIVDAIVDPRRTRETIDRLLRIACLQDPPETFNVGGFQA